MVCFPDLASPRKFHGWLTRRISEGDKPETLLSELSLCQSSMSLCRQLVVAYQGHMEDKREELIQKCLQVDDIRIEAYAQALNSYMRITARSGQHQRYDAPAFYLQPMLEGLRADLLANAKDEFTREVECAIRVALGAAFFLQDKKAEAAREASSSYYWADRLGIDFAVARAKTLLVSLTLTSGKVADSLAMTREGINDANQTITNRRFLEFLEVTSLVRLGQREGVLSALEKQLASSPDPHKINASQLQRQKLILGVGGLDGEIIQSGSGNPAETQLAESLKCLVEYLSLPRSSHTLDQRTDLLCRAIDLWKEENELKDTWTRYMGRWVVGKAYSLLGRPRESDIVLAGLKVMDHQWFDLRLLRLGLNLELALNLAYPDIVLQPLEDQLRDIFVAARQTPFASPEGLAERLIHWCPVAAAYGAVMPDPIYELRPGVAAVLRVGNKNRIYDRLIPPTYAVELALRSMDFDHRLGASFVQSDPGGGRHKKAVLMTTYGEVNYWRPAISAASLVYGLVKAGHMGRARAVYSEFGVVPQSNATYVMLPLAQNIDSFVKQLIDGVLNPTTFSAVVTE